jgi:ATP-dependent DNA helicase RecG
VVVDFCRVIGGRSATREELLAAPLRWPRPSRLSAPLEAGARTIEAARRLGISTLGELVEHVPVTHEFRLNRQFKELRQGEDATVEAELISISLRPTRRRNLRIVEAVLADSSGRGKAVWFNQQWLAKQLTPGVHLRLHGRFKGGALQVREHAVVSATGDQDESGMISVYPGTEGLKSQRIRELIESVRGIELETVEPLPGRLRAAERLIGRADALAEMHFPRDQGAGIVARERLAVEELLLQQLALGLRRRRRTQGRSAIALTAHGTILERWRDGLPFELTAGQEAAIAEIDVDLGGEVPMQRLLMGEVGAGKTVVALAAMLRTVENDAQAALMAPTETLAEQHFATLDAMLPEVPLALLTGSTTAARRKEILARLATGELALIVGTHALIEPTVEFARLALAVVDEQHRFGVRQRAALDGKAPDGFLPHVLHMTATPIPRTLALAAYGDLDVTQIRELPRGRLPVTTRVVTDQQRDKAYELVRARLREGRQAYVVCPLVEESEALQARAATVEAERLASGELKDFRVGLIHGQMSAAEKAAAMRAFTVHETDVLVATSVIEVGVDIPNAAVMVIEDAARYGISQLHQLRGRVGRGEHDSLCLLFGSSGSRRLRAVAKERDGFKLAQVDLELRGAGEELGTRQSGLPRFKVALLPEDQPLLERAAALAQRLLEANATLDSAETVLLRDAVVARYGSELDPIPA